MNTSTVDHAPSRVRALVASLLALFLVVAGVIAAPPASAAGAAARNKAQDRAAAVRRRAIFVRSPGFPLPIRPRRRRG